MTKLLVALLWVLTSACAKDSVDVDGGARRDASQPPDGSVPDADADVLDGGDSADGAHPGDAAATGDARPLRLPYCPTTIDVFGYSNVYFSGCSGTAAPIDALAAGLNDPGRPGYDATLAGRLRERVLADPELVARFGTAWRFRSCAAGGGTLATFVDEEPAGICPDGGNSGRYRAMCTEDPAPVVLFSANDVTNRCHGGGIGDVADDEAAYASDWAFRFEQFRRDRAPVLLFVSPQHEWHGEQGGSLSNPDACTWLRPTWNRSGLDAWRAAHPAAEEVIAVPDLQDEFLRHHSCCAQLGVSCEESWFGPGPGAGDGWVHFGCAGADALADHWFAQLRAFLLDHEFSCEAP